MYIPIFGANVTESTLDPANLASESMLLSTEEGLVGIGRRIYGTPREQNSKQTLGMIEVFEGNDIYGRPSPDNTNFGGYEGLFHDFGNFSSDPLLLYFMAPDLSHYKVS